MGRLLIIILSIILIAGLNSCDKRNRRNVSYFETQCADPWGFGSTRAEKEALIKNYFADKGVIIISIDFVSAGNILVCQACGCYSGRKIIASIDKGDVERMKAHGFFEEDND
jgi:hypothetical protein